MATKRDYYTVLGVDKKATQEEIKRAYRQQALKWHPDRNKSAEAADKFKEINEAYEILSTPDKRQAYDQFGHGAFDQAGGFSARGGPASGWGGGPFTYTYSTRGGSGEDFGGFSDPFEIFEAFFGGSSPFRRQQLTRYSIKLSFNESVDGVEKRIIHKGKEYKIKIPPGVNEGSRIRFSDFYVSIRVEPSDLFKREGDDLFIDKKISFSMACLGGEVEVPTLVKTLKLKIRPGTQPMSLFRLRGKGVPHLRSRGYGDLYVRILLDVPTHLSREQKQILQEFEQTLK